LYPVVSGFGEHHCGDNIDSSLVLGIQS
jgi:hypothetical protein